jgi:hypothetical protein
MALTQDAEMGLVLAGLGVTAEGLRAILAS